jgi:hypothetical protein
LEAGVFAAGAFEAAGVAAEAFEAAGFEAAGFRGAAGRPVGLVLAAGLVRRRVVPERGGRAGVDDASDDGSLAEGEATSGATDSAPARASGVAADAVSTADGADCSGEAGEAGGAAAGGTFVDRLAVVRVALAVAVPRSAGGRFAGARGVRGFAGVAPVTSVAAERARGAVVAPSSDEADMSVASIARSPTVD